MKHLLTRIFNTPLMILPEKLEVITQIMANKIDATIEVNNSETGLMLPAENMKRESHYPVSYTHLTLPTKRIV